MELKKLLGLGKVELVGLDIGTDSVKLVQLQKDGSNYKIVKAATAKINNDQGAEAHRLASISAVKQCLESASVEADNAVTSVYGHDTVVRGFHLPKLPPDQLTQAVEFEARQVCPFDTAKGIVDYHLNQKLQDSDSTPADRNQGVFVAALDDLVRQKKNIVEEAEMNCILVDVNALALLNLLNQCETIEAGKSIAVIDIGRTVTTIAIQGSDGHSFTRDLFIAGDQIISNMAEMKKVSKKDIEEAIEKSYTPDFPEELNHFLEVGTQDFITDIIETLRFYSSEHPNSELTKILVCGGFSLSEGIIQIMNNYLPVSVKSWDPLKSLAGYDDTNDKDLIEYFGPGLAVATGLAMRSV